MSDIKIKVEWNKTVLKSINKQMSQEVINSVEGSSELRKEINKTFKQANSRIATIEKNGLYSPAVASLGKQGVKGYSKFSTKNFSNDANDWQELKKEYAKAVSFLQQPTSTSSGTKQWEKSVQSELGLTDAQFNTAVESLMNDYNAVTPELIEAQHYKDFIQQIYDEAMITASTQIEIEAEKIADDLEEQIEKQSEEVAGDAINEIIEGLEDAFKM